MTSRPCPSLLRLSLAALIPLFAPLSARAMDPPYAARSIAYNFNTPTSGFLRWTSLADLNGDGKLDQVTWTDSRLAFVSLGNGDGTFSAPALITTSGLTGQDTYGGAIVDLDGDGKLDLVTASGGGLSVEFGHGDGTFGLPTDYAIGYGYPMASADFNGDGRPDIVRCDTTSVFLCLGTGGGALGAPSTFSLSNLEPAGWSLSVYDIVPVDLNRDGHMDLVASLVIGDNNQVTQTYVRPVVVMLGNGNGTFAPGVAYGDSSTRLAVGDFNEDGIPDVLSGLSLYLGRGDGTLQPVRLPGLADGEAAADLNHDGHLDAIGIANLFDPAAAWNEGVVRLGNGDGTFRDPQTSYFPLGALNIAVGDINNDGKPDLAFATYNTFAPVFTLGNGDGTFGARNDYHLDIAPQSISVADVNGDGQLDVLAAGAGGSAIAVLEGNGDGSFSAAPDIPASGPTNVAVVDLNHDGYPELIFGSGSDSFVHILLGTGPGAWTAGPTLTLPGASSRIAVGDLNGDSFPDIVALCAGGATLSAFLGDGTGGFGARTDSPTGSTPGALALGDFNGDGHLDAASSTTSSLLIQLGNGAGGFGASHAYAPAAGGGGISPSIVGVSLGDLNGDSKLDVAMCSAYGISIFLGNGDGTLGLPTKPILYKAADALIADLDSDGKQDLALATEWREAWLGVLPGKGDGTFEPAMYPGDGHTQSGFNSRITPTCIAAADFNGDGILDLVAGNSDSTVSILLHRPASTTGVGPPGGVSSPAFALYGPRTNPYFGGPMRVAFSLASTAPARLALFDVSGRRLRAMELASFGIGRHEVDLEPGRVLMPGLYFITLESGRARRSARVVVLN